MTCNDPQLEQCVVHDITVKQPRQRSYALTGESACMQWTSVQTLYTGSDGHVRGWEEAGAAGRAGQGGQGQGQGGRTHVLTRCLWQIMCQGILTIVNLRFECLLVNKQLLH
jgi:hypothetical protein